MGLYCPFEPTHRHHRPHYHTYGQAGELSLTTANAFSPLRFKKAPKRSSVSFTTWRGACSYIRMDWITFFAAHAISIQVEAQG